MECDKVYCDFCGECFDRDDTVKVVKILPQREPIDVCNKCLFKIENVAKSRRAYIESKGATRND